MLTTQSRSLWGKTVFLRGRGCGGDKMELGVVSGIGSVSGVKLEIL